MQRRAPATHRNRDPILGVLERVLPPSGTVLEVASGTGEHAVYFARKLPGVTWQTSDPDPDARASIEAWIASEGPANVLPPLELDARAEAWGTGPVDAIVCINMIHISPWEATAGLLRGAGRCLRPCGILFLYGPFAVAGQHTAPSNEAFDASLRARDPSWGVRNLDAVVVEAVRSGLILRETVRMPANNLSIVFDRQSLPEP